ncbi:hypothetical protein [Cohnella zeiphila]|uniref:Uncharacterized protein n=1 Tax=Cohnella zeiphila TaxID=2761120 RepID=A0A7X0SK42_9BACL|nr:hypothetical protein [Cohnella zeiphila]MBB6731401.1 hypothetical protein [Cohnella zeiphila]
MRIHKLTVIWMGVVGAISLIVAWVLKQISQDFWSNIAIGILSSGILAIVISIVGYNVERRRILEEFYLLACKAVRNIISYERNGNAEKTMRSVVQMASYDYSALDNAFANIDFFWNGKKHRARIYNNIYSRIVMMRKAISQKSFHFSLYLSGKTTNINVMNHFIEELDKELITFRVSEIEDQEGNKTIMKYAYKNAKDILEKELNTWYFKLMYGKKGLEVSLD